MYFNRTNGGRTIYGFSRALERDQSTGARCPTTPATRIAMDDGRVELTVTGQDLFTHGGTRHDESRAGEDLVVDMIF